MSKDGSHCLKVDCGHVSTAKFTSMCDGIDTDSKNFLDPSTVELLHRSLVKLN